MKTHNYTKYLLTTIKEVIIPEGITTIPNGFFNNLPNLSIIHLPASLINLSKANAGSIGHNKFKFKLAKNMHKKTF